MLTSQSPVQEIKTTVLYRQKIAASLIQEDGIQIPSIRVTNSWDNYRLALKMWDMETIRLQESFYCAYLDRSNKPICYALISFGGISGTIADPKIIFAHALNCGASALVCFHNHPSGNLTPSAADKSLTRNLKEAAGFLDIALLDHLIIGPCDAYGQGDYFSFADQGYL